MNSNRAPLYIIGTVIVIAVVGVIAYVITQSSATPAMDMSQETGDNQESESVDAVQADKVEIKGYAYSPLAITVKVGTKVTWTNQDSVKHTVTSDEEAPDKIDSGLFGKDESFSFTFDKAGTYQYFCQPHPYMKGTVIVTE